MPVDRLHYLFKQDYRRTNPQLHRALEVADRRWRETASTELDFSPDHRSFVARNAVMLLDNEESKPLIAADVLRRTSGQYGHYNATKESPREAIPDGVQQFEYPDGSVAFVLPTESRATAYDTAYGAGAVRYGNTLTPAEIYRHEVESRLREQREAREKGRDGGGYIFGAEVARFNSNGAGNTGGGNKFVEDGDFDKTGQTYGRISTRPTPKHPWHKR